MPLALYDYYDYATPPAMLPMLRAADFRCRHAIIAAAFIDIAAATRHACGATLRY